MTNHLYDALIAPHRGREAVFLHLPDGGTLSYGAFVAEAGRFATVLREMGLRPGDRVALRLQKCPEMLALVMGCLQAGIVFLPLNPAYTAAEVDYFVDNAGASLLVCDEEAAPAMRPVAKAHRAALETLGWGNGSLAARARDAAPLEHVEPRGPDDLAALLYTSGTTGRSKGAMLSHDNLLSNAQVLTQAWRFTAGDVLLHALPIFHTHGLFVATNILLLAGGSMIFLPKFDRDAVIAALPRSTAMMGVPTFYTRLLDDPRLSQAAASVRLFVSGSAPLLADTHRAWEARTGHRILERYGMTETNMTTSNPYEGVRKPGTVGPPLPGVDVKISDPDTGDACTPREIGVIETRGPNVFQGYWQMPEKTAAELRPDGFFITGDLGYLDEDGYVVIVGRGKDLIISGGLNIYPKEVETVIDAQPGVLESAVVGVPHPDFGETPVAVIVPAHRAMPDLDAIAVALKGRLAGFKQPRRLILRDALPRNTMGKVQKAALRAELAQIFQPVP